jgi:hypothetical protein
MRPRRRPVRSSAAAGRSIVSLREPHEVGRRERRHEEVTRAELHGGDRVLDRSVRPDDDRGIGRGAARERPHELQRGPLRQLEIGHDEVDRVGGDALERVLGRAGTDDGEAAALERVGERRAPAGLGVHQENPSHRHRPPPPRPSRSVRGARAPPSPASAARRSRRSGSSYRRARAHAG